jgi:hypothetical protein
MKLPKKFRFLIGMRSETKTVVPDLRAGGVNADTCEADPHLTLRVPFVAQQHVNLCGDACALMLLKFWGRDTLGRDTNTNPRGPLGGSGFDDICSMFPHENWRAPFPIPPKAQGWTARKLAYQLATVGPLIVSLPRHWVVLIGAQGQQLYIHDPWRGPNLVKDVGWLNKSLDWKAKPCLFYLSMLSEDGREDAKPVSQYQPNLMNRGRSNAIPM